MNATAIFGHTLTPTALICRAVVEGTFDNGLTLRDTPGGSEVDILAESSILTVLTEEEPVEFNGLQWRKVRSLLGDVLAQLTSDDRLLLIIDNVSTDETRSIVREFIESSGTRQVELIKR